VTVAATAFATALAVVLAVVFCPSVARAAEPFTDPYALPDAPRPPTLPELTHGNTEISTEITAGVVNAKDPTTGASSGATSMVERLSAEIPVGARRWFVGGTYEAALGQPSTGARSMKLVGGNLELYGRVVWATRTGLTFGGGLAVVAPTAAYDEGSRAQSVAQAAATLRTWDSPLFLSGYETTRLFGDVRVLDGRFVVQFREGLDLSVPFAGSKATQLAALAALYVGYRPVSFLDLGVEAFEYYFLGGAVRDDNRATLFVSPGVRFIVPYVQPALSVYRTVGTPLNADVNPIGGIRLAITVVLEGRRMK
jgi:hypothetical protein